VETNQRNIVRVAIIAFVALTITAAQKNAALADDADFKGWQRLPVTAYLDKGREIRYCETETAEHTKISILVVPIDQEFELKPVVNQKTCPTSEAASKAGALAAVNAGFFNLHGGASTGSSTGYITINGQQISNPRDNDALTKNPKLQPYIDKIFDRTELRCLTDAKGKITIRIQRHSEALPDGYTLKHALQAGPRLLPSLTDREESFLRSEPTGETTDSIGCMKPAARTAFGITSDGKAIIICVSGPRKDEFSAGMTLQQLADFMKKLGCVEAINFDGGASTTMAIKASSFKGLKAYSISSTNSQSVKTNGFSTEGYYVVCGRSPETNVKSCLLVLSKPKRDPSIPSGNPN